jgi:YD repeat-containing protein
LKRAVPGPAVLLFAILVAGAAWGEDRIETIRDSKGYRELVYRGESLAEERSYDPLGSILEETTMGPSSLPLETRTYIRAGDRLVRVEARDGAGDQIGSRTYRYDRNGRLLGADSEGSLGPGSVGMIASQGLPQGSWVSGATSAKGAATSVLGYDRAGRATRFLTLVEGKAVSLESRAYAEGGSLKSVRLEDRVSGLVSDSLYDDEGRILTRTDSPAKGPRLRIEYSYDASGRLAEEKSFGQGKPFTKTYQYSEDGSVARAETRRDGILLLALSFIPGGRQEELYEDGVIFVRATYLGGRKVKDEFFSDGQAFRTRDY